MKGDRHRAVEDKEESEGVGSKEEIVGPDEDEDFAMRWLQIPL
jgi:hypothetical protein